MDISKIKIGMILKLDGNMYYVTEYNYITSPNATVVRTVLKSVDLDTVIEHTFGKDDVLEVVDIEDKSYQYSYSDDNFAYFTECETKEIYKVHRESVVITNTTSTGIYTFHFGDGRLVSITPPTYLDVLVEEEK